MSDEKTVTGAGLVSAADWLRRNVAAPVIEAGQETAHVATNARDLLRSISDSHHSAPIHAFVRQGADELSQVLAAFPDGVQPASEAGQLFEPTQAMVTEQLTGRPVNAAADLLEASQQPQQDMGMERGLEGRSM